MKILIGTPTGDGSVGMQYMMSIRNLEARFRNLNPPIRSEVMFGTASFMPFSRNALASIVLGDRSYTHLLFVDSDMGFTPEAVLKLVQSSKDVIGCLYPKRGINFERFHAISRNNEDPIISRNVTLEYAASEMLQKVQIQQDGRKVLKHRVEDGLIRSLRLGMGLTLIRRTVFERMADVLPELMIDSGRALNYRSMGLKGQVIQCFSSVTSNGLSLSEDLSFCHRWTEQCGGEIWAVVDQEIAHIGETTFRGKAIDRLQHDDGI